MFERFSEAALQAVYWARHSVSQLGGDAIEPPHLLVGLARAEGRAARVLQDAGLGRRDVLELLADVEAERPSESVEIPLSAASTAILRAAVSEADQMDSEEITTGHLLLGLLRDQDVPVFRVLHEAGIRLNDVRLRVAQAIADGPEKGAEADDLGLRW